MAQTNFETLEVYQLSERLSDTIWHTVLTWDNLAKDTLGKQLIRSADSVGANIAEGSGRNSGKDQLYFLRIARGSLYETKHWLRRAYKRNLLTPNLIDSLKELLDLLIRKLNSYYSYLKAKEKNY